MILPSRPFGIVASTQTIMLKKALAAANVTPDAIDFPYYIEGDGVSPCYGYAYQQITGITVPITVRFDFTTSVGTQSPEYKITSTEPTDSCYFDVVGSTTNIVDGTTLSISNGEYLIIANGGYGDPFSSNYYIIDIVNESDGDAVLDTIFVRDTPCFLTTAVVNYMGLLDNGPELTAMRMLREHYRDVPGYAEIIQEYYTNSQAIIDAINSSQDASIEYDYIYNTVIAVMNHVNAEEWQQAHDLYLAMYNDLKKRYLG